MSGKFDERKQWELTILGRKSRSCAQLIVYNMPPAPSFFTTSVNHASYKENLKTGLRAFVRTPVFGQALPIMGFTEYRNYRVGIYKPSTM